MAEQKKATLGIRCRTILFYALSGLAVLPFLLLIPCLFLPRRITVVVSNAFLRLQLWLLRVTCGVRYEIKGLSSLPDTAYLVASQHESAWETLFFQLFLGQPVMFAKKEVFGYPLIGIIARKLGHISVDRQGSADAMREGFRKGQDAALSGRNLLIFPTGTRSTQKDIPIQSGIGVLYQLLKLPVVPVLLNSGQCWPSGGLLKHPGKITVQILPAIPANMDRREFLNRLSKDLSDTI